MYKFSEILNIENLKTKMLIEMKLKYKLMIISSISFILVALFAFLSRDGRAIESAVKGNLRDPASAVFGKMTISINGHRACIEYNARNGFGGYGENSIAQLVNEAGVWHVKNMNEIPENCDSAGLAVLDARDSAQASSDNRFISIINSVPKFSGRYNELTAFGGECLEALSNYRMASMFAAEYSVRAKMNALSDIVFIDKLKNSSSYMKKIERELRSGNCNINESFWYKLLLHKYNVKFFMKKFYIILYLCAEC